MGNRPGPKSEAATKLVAIEHLAKRFKAPAWVLAGMMQRHNWGAGKELSEQEFLAAGNAFLTGPAGGTQKKEVN
ncbi:MAG: hypothetical protein U1D96_05385 [Eubacteriales bacterium]|nr:hypothetical protein [Eubacteriales bacterium]